MNLRTLRLYWCRFVQKNSAAALHATRDDMKRGRSTAAFNRPAVRVARAAPPAGNTHAIGIATKPRLGASTGISATVTLDGNN